MKLGIIDRTKFGNFTNSGNKTHLNNQVKENITKKIRKYFEVNKNKNMTYQDTLDTANGIHAHKYVTANAYIKKRFQIHNLSFHFKILEKEEQAKPKARRKEINI